MSSCIYPFFHDSWIPLRKHAIIMTMALSRTFARAWRLSNRSHKCLRSFASSATPSTPLSSPFAPRHLLSISDLTTPELETLIRNAFVHKQAAKSGKSHLSLALQSQTVAMMFTKRSTRTRVSTEAAVVAMGGHPMFLGQTDIQLKVIPSASTSEI